MAFFFLTLRGEFEYSSQPQSDEEELELPLPLRSDDEWQHSHQSPFPPPHHNVHNYGEEKKIQFVCLMFCMFLLVKSSRLNFRFEKEPHSLIVFI